MALFGLTFCIPRVDLNSPKLATHKNECISTPQREQTTTFENHSKMSHNKTLQGEASKYIWTFAHKGTFHSFGKIKVRQFLLIFKHYAKVPFGVCVCFLHTPLYLRRKSNHINGREMVNLPMELYVGGNNSTWRSRWTCNAKMESLQRRKMWLSHETLLLRLLQLQ